MRCSSISARILSPPAVIASLFVAVSCAERVSTSAFHLSVFSWAAACFFARVSSFARSSSISCLRLNSPAERETLPPVNEPPALITCPSAVTTRLR